MGILETAKPLIVICTRDRARAAAYYRDTLGLTMTSEDDFAAIFDAGGTSLRVSTVADFVAHEHTILGFKVPNVTAAVKALRDKGVIFYIDKKFPQDELGVLTLPGGAGHVAWFSDPDGNVLSVTDA